MKRKLHILSAFFLGSVLLLGCCFSSCKVNTGKALGKSENKALSSNRKTHVSIVGEKFYINGKPTFEGRKWKGHTIEGLLPNSRMANAIFDDLNPETRNFWNYPDTNEWDPERNTDEFIANLPLYKSYGLLSFNINMQGGNPRGYANLSSQRWRNSAFDADGELRADYMERLKRVLDRADELEMVPNLGLFYFGQDQYFKDEEAIIKAVDNTVEWLFKQNYRNVIIEVANECDNENYDQPLLKPERIHTLIDQIKAKEKDGFRFLVSTSFIGAVIPTPEVVEKSDYIILHGNAVKGPQQIAQMVKEVRAMKEYTPKPIYFNEDDHFDFDKENNHFVSATTMYASWGLFDLRMKGEPFEDGFQSIPVDWGINSERKKGFFNLLKEMTGGLQSNL